MIAAIGVERVFDRKVPDRAKIRFWVVSVIIARVPLVLGVEPTRPTAI